MVDGDGGAAIAEIDRGSSTIGAESMDGSATIVGRAGSGTAIAGGTRASQTPGADGSALIAAAAILAAVTMSLPPFIGSAGTLPPLRERRLSVPLLASLASSASGV